MAKKFIEYFFVALAAISSMVTLVSFLWKIDWSLGGQWGMLIIMIAICIAFAIFSLQKKKINLNLSDGLEVTIQKADLFEQEGVIVICFNEYFDTHIGDGVINPDSVHGSFIYRLFKNNVNELDKLIETSLKNDGILPIEQNCKRKTVYGKTNKYRIGSCVSFEKNGNIYVLVALSHFDDRDIAHLTRKEYNDCLGSLMIYLKRVSEDLPVHMPLLGAGLTRLNRTPQRILLYMLDSLDFIHAQQLLGGLFIDILSLKETKINLTIVKNALKNRDH